MANTSTVTNQNQTVINSLFYGATINGGSFDIRIQSAPNPPNPVQECPPRNQLNFGSSSGE